MIKIKFIYVVILVATFASDSIYPENSPIRLMWQVHPTTSKKELNLLREMGINTIQSFSFLGKEPDIYKSHLSIASELGLKVIPYIGRMVNTEDREKCYISDSDILVLDVLVKFRSLYAWHTFDEPYFRDHANAMCQRSVYRQLKKHISFSKGND